MWIRIIAILLTSASGVLGLGIRLPDQHPHATARGNAFAATADNPSAVYYNPAGITQLEGYQATLGTYGIIWRAEYESPTGREFDTEDTRGAIPQFYTTFNPKSMPLSFGLGLFSPYGLNVQWPQDSGFRTLAKEGDFKYFSIKPVVGWEIHPNLSLAVGPTLNYGDAMVRQGLFPPGNEFEFEGDDMALGYSAGLLWQPHQQHSFGLSYRSVTTLDLEGTSDAGPFGRDGDAEARFKFPQHIIAGWSYRPTPKWNLELNIDWTDWERLDQVTVKQSFGDTSLPFFWESSVFVELGVTRKLSHGLSISGGYIFSEETVPDEGFNPLIPDQDRHFLSLGVGWEHKQFRGDLAYQVGYGPTRDVRGSPRGIANPVTGQRQSADGDYTFFSHAVSIAVNYSF